MLFTRVERNESTSAHGRARLAFTVHHAAVIIPECEPARCTTLKRGRTLHGEAATHPPVSCDTRSSSAAHARLYGRGSAPKLRTEP